MFKYAIVLAVIAISASLAGSIPEAKEPVVASTNIAAIHKKHAPAFVPELGTTDSLGGGNGGGMSGNGGGMSDIGGGMTGIGGGMTGIGGGMTGIGGGMTGIGGSTSGIGWLLDSGLISIMDLVAVPKKLFGTLIIYMINKLRTMDTKKVVHTVLVTAVIAVLGAVASVSVAGLVTLVHGICAVLPYIRLNLNGNDSSGGGQSANPKMDAIGQFLLSAFEKYDSSRRKA